MTETSPRHGVASCRWRYLLFLNYRVHPALLEPFLPVGTQLDLFHGSALVSVVGLTFKNAKALGIPLPFQQDYEQISLRFYVKCPEKAAMRLGTVCVREIVSHPHISWLGHWLYNESYSTFPTERHLRLSGNSIHVQYAWQDAGGRSELEGTTEERFHAPDPASEEAFLSHRLWSYAAQRDGATTELSFHHPVWQIARVHDPRLTLSDPEVFGPSFSTVLQGAPHSAFLAQGSRVTIGASRRVSKPMHEALVSHGI
jgi:uncharacterized protein